MPPSAKCGGASCKGTVIPFVNIAVPACCADEATNQCGLDTSGLADFGASFSEPCQALDQPGTPDPACPQSTATMVELPTGGSFPLQFPGCCRANHTCGYNLDTIGGAFPLDVRVGGSSIQFSNRRPGIRSKSRRFAVSSKAL